MTPITQLQPCDFTGRLLSQGDVVVFASGRNTIDYGIVVSYDKKVGHILRLLRANHRGDYTTKQTITSDNEIFAVYIVDYKSKSVPCPVMQAINSISEPFNLVKDKPVIHHTPDEFLHRFYRALTRECKRLKTGHNSRYNRFRFSNKYNSNTVYANVAFTGAYASHKEIVSVHVGNNKYAHDSVYIVYQKDTKCTCQKPFLIDNIPIDPVVVNNIIRAEIYA